MLKACFAVLLTLCAAGVSAQSTPAKPRIATEADLPRFTYPVRGTTQQLVEAPASEFLAFARPVRADIEKLLTGYDISDRGTLRQLLEARLGIDLIEGGRDREAVETARQMRVLEDKPAEKLTGGLGEEVFARLRSAAPPSASSLGMCPAGYEGALRAAVAPLPWAEVASAVKQMRNLDQVASPQLFIGFADTRVGPAVDKQHAVNLSEAMYLIRTRAALLVIVPCAKPALAALDPYLRAHAGGKPDIWAARQIVFPPDARLTPVKVAIWDSGIDAALFPGRMYTNPARTPEEDPHGIAFDVHSLPTHGELMPLTPEQQARYGELVREMEGVGDFQTGADTPAAAAFRARLSKLSAPEMRSFMDNLGVAEGYAHGTHVAGTAADGNPAIRLAEVRMTYDNNNPHLPPSEQEERNLAAAEASAVGWFKAHGVRVVNMSWWNRPSNIEKDLADNGIGKDDADRKEIARRYFAIEREALYKAIQGAPEILFVTIAGNNNADNAFEECIPSSFVLPNLLVTGAVDGAGDETAFTSYGANVLVHADGFAVPSVVPGGAVVKQSGTSMAAPEVINLAAKLLAVDPALTPVQVIALIRGGATTTGDGRRHLIDPARSMQLLEERMRTQRVARNIAGQ